MLKKIGKGLLAWSAFIVFAFLLHIMNGVVLAIYKVPAYEAGALTSLMTIAEISILEAVADRN